MAYPVFDLHCDTADRIGWATLDLDLRFTAGTDGYFPGDETHPQDFDLIEGNACAISLAKIGNTPWAQCFATFVPDEIPAAHAACFQAQIMAHMSGQAMLNHDRMVNVRSAADIRPALKEGKVACIHTIENATFFAEDPALIEVLKSLGVLMSSLSWNAQGPLASGHDTHAGLTAAGIEALTQMEHAGMVLDVSHLNDECFDEVAARATRPSSPATPTPVRFAASNATLPTTSSVPFATWAASSASTTAASSYLTKQPTRPPQMSPSTSWQPISSTGSTWWRGRHRTRWRLGRRHGTRLPLRCQQDARIPEHALQALWQDRDAKALQRQRACLL